MSNSERDRLAEADASSRLWDNGRDRSFYVQGYCYGFDAGVESERKKTAGLVEALNEIDDGIDWGEDTAIKRELKMFKEIAHEALAAYKQESEGEK